jgi:hypothetical protein
MPRGRLVGLAGTVLEEVADGGIEALIPRIDQVFTDRTYVAGASGREPGALGTDVTIGDERRVSQ